MKNIILIFSIHFIQKAFQLNGGAVKWKMAVLQIKNTD